MRRPKVVTAGQRFQTSSHDTVLISLPISLFEAFNCPVHRRSMTPEPKTLEAGVAEPSADYDDPKAMRGEVDGLPTETHRGLSSRHVQFLALGGCIGTGLFVGSGQTLSMVGPGKILREIGLLKG